MSKWAKTTEHGNGIFEHTCIVGHVAKENKWAKLQGFCESNGDGVDGASLNVCVSQNLFSQ